MWFLILISIPSLLIGTSVSASKCPVFQHKFPYRTPSPININTKTVQVVNVSTPLTLGIGALNFIFLQNTGKSVEGRPGLNLPFFLTGGILCNEKYTYSYGRFYINLNGTGSRSGHTIDGEGVPLEATIYYFKDKYKTLKNALNYRDGIAVAVQRVVIRPIPNLLFIPLQLVFSLGLLKKPGSVFPVLSPLEAGWFDDLALVNKYYVYPGSYTDPHTGKEYDSAIYLVLAPLLVSLSETQFQSFSNILGDNGQPIQTVAPLAPAGKRPVLEVHGQVAQLLVL